MGLKNSKWVYYYYYWLIMGLHLVAILLFTKGFLLTRTELPYYSHCSDVTQSPCLHSFSSDINPNLNQSHHNHQCWTKPTIGRLIIIVLDALRFDFVAPSTFFQESKPWMDKLQVLQELASQKPSSARIFKAIADPPTTSLQRLKGITTGGLPTFIDVGNSFGAPAITEDNLLHQLVQNGKRVVMMGDDTWMQLFPRHFERSYPFPSFNVKDLDTVDNGCIDHLIPSLYQEDWDVLIAHFLGVDHAGHIFGVDSVQMLEKLEQYNVVLQKVIEVLKSQSETGGLHENTFLLVMGDHGQTINGDHGGGGPEEVETSIFAMNFKQPPSSVQSKYNTSSGESDLDKKNLRISSIQQLDFAATISALLGIPFPFGSIGHVNPELYALGAGTLNFKGVVENCENQSNLEEWMLNYANVLCMNSWQVKKYIDVYSASSVIGFSSEDLFHIADLYAQAAEKWVSHTKNFFTYKNKSCNTVLPALERQIDAYSNFLASVAELARSKWTEFNLKLMAIGFGIMLLSICIHILAITKVKRQNAISFSASGDSGISFGLFFACFIVAIRACSFLSNSYILEEGKVASFLLATSGIVKLRDSIKKKKKMVLEVIVFLLVITICRLTIEVGLSKQTPGFDFLKFYPSWMLRSTYSLPVLSFITEIVPVIFLMLLAILLYKAISSGCSEGLSKYVAMGSILSYMLIAIHWVSEINFLSPAWVLGGIGRNLVPRIIYAIGFAQLLLLMFHQLFNRENSFDWKKILVDKTVAVLSSCSSTIIILLGKQGPLVSVAAIIGGYCIMMLGNIKHDANNKGPGNSTIDPLTVTQWSILGVCLFFCTGHWCAFDGLRYGAAFIGYTGRGLFLDPPTVFLCNNTWNVSLPEGMRSSSENFENITFSSRNEVFNTNRDKSNLAETYSLYISRVLEQYPKSEGLVGALIMEPVIQGAGGMHFVDPLFQRVLVNVCRSKNIPIIFDEVFTGFWRLGTETAAELLSCVPDIACFAKLMTGGIIPLAATLATNAVFDSFIGDSKLKALLHGHSYSAHAMGCTAAAKSIKWFKDPRTNPNIVSEGRLLRELWDKELVYLISSHPAVERVVALGTLCALELRAEGPNAGYASTYARSLLKKLCEDGVYMRPLGNVIYLMCGPCTSPEICHQVLTKVYRRLDEFSRIR